MLWIGVSSTNIRDWGVSIFNGSSLYGMDGLEKGEDENSRWRCDGCQDEDEGRNEK